jgi:hypothetical protein
MRRVIGVELEHARAVVLGDHPPLQRRWDCPIPRAHDVVLGYGIERAGRDRHRCSHRRERLWTMVGDRPSGYVVAATRVKRFLGGGGRHHRHRRIFGDDDVGLNLIAGALR